METVSLPQQNLDGLDWRARNQLKFRNKVGSLVSFQCIPRQPQLMRWPPMCRRFVPATSNPLLERLMSMASPERRRSSPEKTRSSRLPDHSSSSNPTKASAPRKQVLKASSKSKVGATSSSSTQQKRKRVILADSESDDPLAGPHPKVPKRTNRIAGLSSKGSNRASAPVGEKGNGDPDSKTANALPLRDISKKDATGLTHTVAPSRRRQNILSCIIEQGVLEFFPIVAPRFILLRYIHNR
ncbi:hypothetical protein BS47DRAFT_626015 [Hydnum rufescens UP504]|uniref:Uncharacterized protein n=1 Tax=Hydnum rufescens UP504 TaxID=1448309 RepID=A0A9P6DZ66_9AGAM|nr:hypothetical protein BS47DRAFT_626015 [Hydnum rufescens UP504]